MFIILNTERPFHVTLCQMLFYFQILRPLSFVGIFIVVMCPVHRTVVLDPSVSAVGTKGSL
jgi:hypothetical protein